MHPWPPKPNKILWAPMSCGIVLQFELNAMEREQMISPMSVNYRVHLRYRRHMVRVKEAPRAITDKVSRSIMPENKAMLCWDVFTYRSDRSNGGNAA